LQNIGYIPTYTSQKDLFVDGYIFEIGGKNKSDKQIKILKLQNKKNGLQIRSRKRFLY